MNKKEVLSQLLALLNEKANVFGENVQSIKDSQSDDTKSSAGDKFETGREMMQTELDKNEAQLGKIKLLIRELEKIDSNKVSYMAEFGSLVCTSKGNYFISVGLGKVIINEEICFAISLNSPIGKMLKGKKTGELIQFQGNEIRILEVI